MLQNTCVCGGPLLAKYDLDSFKKEFDPALWTQRPKGLWRYWELLPVNSVENAVTLGEGGTPVLKMCEIGKMYGLNNLYIKDEGLNPTGTFKARGAAVGVSKLRSLEPKSSPCLLQVTLERPLGCLCSQVQTADGVAMPQDAPF